MTSLKSTATCFFVLLCFVLRKRVPVAQTVFIKLHPIAEIAAMKTINIQSPYLKELEEI